jgi:hypothetical protein
LVSRVDVRKLRRRNKREKDLGDFPTSTLEQSSGRERGRRRYDTVRAGVSESRENSNALDASQTPRGICGNNQRLVKSTTKESNPTVRGLVLQDAPRPVP